MEDEEFQKNFFSDKIQKSVVMSIDLRKSTSLMLKAKTPFNYAQFMERLAKMLVFEIKENYGIFDKFTGDGILAFFPEFYSGGDAVCRAARVALNCHTRFKALYKDCRPLFKSVLNDTGLGIGIDFGDVCLFNVGDGLTVVGEPVVYACRFSVEGTCTTTVNQPAFEMLREKYGDAFSFIEKNVEVKNEGNFLGYQMTGVSRKIPLQAPSWEGKPANN